MGQARDYVEAIALELSRLRGGGLVLSPADAQLALAWHAAAVPLPDVLAEVRRGSRLRSRGGGTARGAQEPNLSLQALRGAVEAKLVRPARARAALRAAAGETGLSAQLLAAAASASLPAREAWLSLAREAEHLLAAGGDAYWGAAVLALRAALRELPRPSVLLLGKALREKRAPRPASMPRQGYRRSLQLQLLSAASERLSLPPRAFLL